VQQADQTERQAGSRVRYTVTVRNTAAAALTDVLVQAMLPVELLLINAEDGRTSGNTITWNIPSIAPDEIRTFTYSVAVRQGTAEGEIATTIAQVSAPSLAAPVVATTGIRVVAPLPQTGAEDRFFSPPEDTSRYLKPLK